MIFAMLLSLLLSVSGDLPQDTIINEKFELTDQPVKYQFDATCKDVIQTQIKGSKGSIEMRLESPGGKLVHRCKLSGWGTSCWYEGDVKEEGTYQIIITGSEMAKIRLKVKLDEGAAKAIK